MEIFSIMNDLIVFANDAVNGTLFPALEQKVGYDFLLQRPSCINDLSD